MRSNSAYDLHGFGPLPAFFLSCGAFLKWGYLQKSSKFSYRIYRIEPRWLKPSSYQYYKYWGLPVYQPAMPFFSRCVSPVVSGRRAVQSRRCLAAAPRPALCDGRRRQQTLRRRGVGVGRVLPLVHAPLAGWPHFFAETAVAVLEIRWNFVFSGQVIFLRC